MDNKMYFKRKIYDKLVEWKKNSDGKTALLIEGARRIGKSTIVELFAKNEYENYLIIDFNIAPNEIKDLFINERSDIDLILQKLQSFYGKVLPVRKSLIIFDEVQFCPEARSMIKYLVADGRYDYLETGSLISIKKNVENILIPSEERKINMYPLDFEEFLWTLNDNATIPFLRDCYINKKKVDIAHKRIMKDFRTYILVGGMPQAVEMYSKTRDFEKVDRIKRNILNLYREDIRKHAEELNLKVEQIFDTIPSQLQKHEKKFNISSLDEEARYRNFEGAFYWLNDAYLVNIAYNTTEPSIGLGQRMDTNALKCYMFDTDYYYQ